MRKILLLSILNAMILSISACGKADSSSKSSKDTGDYAINSVLDSHYDSDYYGEINDITKVTTTTSVTTVKETLPEIKPITYVTQEDVNADKIDSIETLSIDGKLVTFPCDYNDLKETFGKLYTVNNNKFKTYVEVDETVTGTYFELEAKPTTGAGTIKFYMFSKTDDPCNLTDMECRRFTLVGGDTTDNVIMSLGFPNGVNFGQSMKEIIDNMGSPNKKTTNNNVENGDFTLNYTPDGKDYQYTFTGLNGRLFQIDIKYYN